MPISNYPFGIPDDFAYKKPSLPIILYNPVNGFDYRTVALIDTGADTTIIPEHIAKALYHDIRHKDVKRDSSWGIGGEEAVYIHTFSMDILAMEDNGQISDRVVIHIPSKEFAVVSSLGTVILGEQDFLSKYILSINYPKQIFSVKAP